jgi:L-fuculose-phosphate aldolase
LITPSQKDRQRLRIDDLVLIEGDRHEPNKIPSRASRQHQAIYRAHPEIQSIVFAHPVNATAFSITAAPMDARTIPESYLFLRNVPRIPYGVQYGMGTPAIERTLSLKSPVAIVENDGAVVVGTSVLDVFDRLEVLESTAEAMIDASCVGEIITMHQTAIDDLHRAFGID